MTLENIIKFAQNSISDTAEYISKWNEYAVYEPGFNDDEIIAKLKKQLNTDGRYVLGINRKDGSGHLVSIDKVNGKIIVKDEQLDVFSKIESLEELTYLEVLRIDKSIFNISKIKSILGF